MGLQETWMGHQETWMGPQQARMGSPLVILRKNALSIPNIQRIYKYLWREVTPDYLINLYASMLHRMELCIQAEGGCIKY